MRSDALGAQSIAEWVQHHSQQVFPLVTQAFSDYLATLEAGLRAPRDLGERAAVEAIRHTLVLAPHERAVFITEDDRLLTGTYVVLEADQDRMISITTRDFLEGLEEAQRINSADDVYRRAEDAGRFASRRATLASQHERAICGRKESPTGAQRSLKTITARLSRKSVCYPHPFRRKSKSHPASACITVSM